MWLQGDVVGLKARVGGILQQLDAARRLAAASVAGLAEMDAVKQRMEAAASTLKVSQTHTFPAGGHIPDPRWIRHCISVMQPELPRC